MIEYNLKFSKPDRAKYNIGTIACSHPGKIGDALYAIPTMRHLANTNKAKIDFFTSEYCKPLIELMDYQSFTKGVYISADYKIANTKIGVQPWHMPIHLGYYNKVIHLGFRREPDKRLDHFIAGQIGIDEQQLEDICYEYENTNTLDVPYIVLAPAGRKQHLHKDTMYKFMKRCPIQVVQIGAPGEFIGGHAMDKTGLNMLGTLPWIANSKGFVGMLSSNLVLANGFDIPRVCLLPRKNWKSHHAITSLNNHYILHSTSHKIMGALGL